MEKELTRNGEAIIRRSDEEIHEEAQANMWKFVFGFTEMAVIKCAIELGIADFLEKNQHQHVTLNQLSTSLACCSSSLYRILRFLINRGIFKETSTKYGEIGYVQTPLSRLLVKEGRNSMAAFLLFESSPVMLAPWHNLSACISSKDNNTPPFDAAHKRDIWKYAEVDSEHNNLLNSAMACDARITVSAIVNDYPKIFDGVKTIVDVGGGNGTTLRSLVEAFPWINGINFDLPHVVSVAPHANGMEQLLDHWWRLSLGLMELILISLMLSLLLLMLMVLYMLVVTCLTMFPKLMLLSSCGFCMIGEMKNAYKS
ncbi:hypothetical protein HAX54_045706 [Datura stramonium]|uniref:O-methyltransferase n=1 Tax=Datura stramonium TaxID=4076 RepID=A0ABS8WKU7_DATST|nr:hypothetical protein [Datura stramonium]